MNLNRHLSDNTFPMKNVLLLFTFVSLYSLELCAQVPFKFDYQAAVRDNQGEILPNQSVFFRFTIHSETAYGDIVYQEFQNLNTNEFGLVNCTIGEGSVTQGALNSAVWLNIQQFLQVEVNIGNGYVDMGSNDLNAVPYALVAEYVNLGLDELTDVITGPLENKNILFYDLDHWEAGTGSEVLQAGSGISISGNTITNAGDMNGNDDANMQLSNLLNTAINTSLVPANSISSLGNQSNRWQNVYLDQGVRFSFGAKITVDQADVFIETPINDYDTDMSFGLGAGVPTSGGDNSFFGFNSGNAISTGSDNSCFGNNSGEDFSTGSNNSAFGSNAGLGLSSGDQNSYFGANAGSYGVNVDNNTYIGFRAGRDNTSGSNNVYVGSEAGISGPGSNNTSVGTFTTPGGGGNNVVIGYAAGTGSASAADNTYVGMNSGGGNGSFNVCLGFDAGGSQTSGSECTFLGYSAEGSGGTYINATAIGYQSSVTASNRVRVGNTSITQIGGQVAWSNLSDARLKKNIAPSTLGLDFITKLEPVTYNFIEGHEGILYTGFLAQDVEKVLNEMGQDFSGITKPENETDFYSIRYAEFVMPLVNSVQELNSKVISLQMENDELKKRVELTEKTDLVEKQQKMIEAMDQKIKSIEIQLQSTQKIKE
ncbi:MAG: tail fiber domain-containing protein [Flavobacteriales bacterium]|nr:tail fiber domain-containing protein [Flavobacteriales bacterium]